MINYKDRKQLTFYELPSWKGHLSEKKVKKLEKTWAGPFREFVAPNFPVSQIAQHYSPDNGRPTKELGMVIGAVILQQIHDLTDEQTVDQLSFNQQWHFALDVFDPNEHVISLKTLWTMRQLMLQEDLCNKLFDTVAENISDRFNVDNRLQRIDSTAIKSNIARMGRIKILKTAIKKFLKNLKRHHSDLYRQLSSIFARLDHYKKNLDENYFGEAKPSESSNQLIDIAGDMYFLIQHFSNEDAVTNMHSYALLIRIFSEHCRVEDGQMIVIPNSEIASTSVQNPFDIDATYDGHKKNSGYKVQLMESFAPLGNNELNLITHVDVTPAHIHDSKAIEPALAHQEEGNMAAEAILADAAYGSDDNVEFAKAKAIELVSPVMGDNKQFNFEGFVFDKKTDEVLSCPVGKSPDRILRKKKTGMILNYWEKSTCAECPLLDQCGVGKLKKFNRLKYRSKDLRLWLRRQYQETEEYGDVYRYRSGVEGTVSHFVHDTGGRRLRYRGIDKVKFACIFKAMGLNIFRTARFLQKLGFSLKNAIIFNIRDVKKQLSSFWDQMLDVQTELINFSGNRLLKGN